VKNVLGLMLVMNIVVSFGLAAAIFGFMYESKTLQGWGGSVCLGAGIVGYIYILTRETTTKKSKVEEE